ncbi:hypothetical protein [Thioalkalivibrio sp. XN279]|uniref:hypothetical protein n=1 Tax=Thioalkalivibrio sp. XN279 TaxID=2714953 RepID=UPI0014096F10|nr:hypothetical protein [Thioalkalivibrio sp. XN279]NHA14618.1 hypothetical protein [Thioalkalivibrio sp. XN279]
MKNLLLAVAFVLVSGCASITNDPMVPVALSFSNASSGKCDLSNKRGSWSSSIPNTVSIRRSDDHLQYRCRTKAGEEVTGSIPSTMGGKIVASAVFLDFGIVDSITDKHREYPASYVIPVPVSE